MQRIRLHEQTAPGGAMACPCQRGEDAVIAGVCCGIARKLDADPILVRVTAVVLAVCTCGLAVIPYAVCAVKWPKACAQDEVLESEPLSVQSDWRENVVKGPCAPSAQRVERAVRADAAHLPPTPPGEAAPRLSEPSGAPLPMPSQELHSIPHATTLIALALAAAIAVLFGVFAWAVHRYVPTAAYSGFWPLLLAAAGVALLAAPSERCPVSVRLCVMLLCLEVCVALLPFTLGICQPSVVSRLGVAPLLLGAAGLVCLVVAAAKKRFEPLAAAIGLFAVALLFGLADVGLVSRLAIIQSDPRRPVPLWIL